ncbi:hypothetical protein [Arthrobacter sulfonylureivorans]|uniref:DUF222 domain-containing protein n=1 Tax=Arthrobacter sulfonylureivorans TaxID=2486855 RepID=A0ABY3WBU0_9MICC|nr:hypothetical protein [Arthrobacter sulfonylureivorans]UNK46916.1 hypothetical protein MNQ99_06065 [Arthrobacter sulfonylureivorans]
MVDDELSAALRAYREAWHDYTHDPARRRGESVPSGDERFLAEIGAERGQQLLAAVRALRAEAQRVPDPGGPLGSYADALADWAATHPEVDRSEMRRITRELLWAQR